MLSAEQMCRHVGYHLHTPVRFYDGDGQMAPACLQGLSSEDPLLRDPDFARELLAMRQELPVFHRAAESTVFAVIPCQRDESFVLGPVRYGPGTENAAYDVAREHHLEDPSGYRITYVPMDILLESVVMLYHFGNDRSLSASQLLTDLAGDTDYRMRAQDLSYSVVYNLREISSSHNSYAQEVREQKAIREGDLDALRASWAEVNNGLVGRLGKDDVTHYRNLAVTVLALASRSAIEGGVLPEQAYSLSDSYINILQELTDPMELYRLMRTAEINFAELVAQLSENRIRSSHVIRCKELVHTRLHQRLQVADLAKELGLTRSYLSQIFLKEEGIRLNTYILEEKIRASEYLLMRSDRSIEEIASIFGFSSQSHYGQVFKRCKGMSPGVFREMHQMRK